MKTHFSCSISKIQYSNEEERSHLLPARSPGAVACKLVVPQAAKLPPPHFERRLNEENQIFLPNRSDSTLNRDILLPLTIPSPPPTGFFFLQRDC